MWYVYILECGDGTLYTGVTTDVGRRFKEHQQGIRAKYTRAKGVKRLLYTEEQPDRSAAYSREMQIKRWTRDKKFQLIGQAERDKTQSKSAGPSLS